MKGNGLSSTCTELSKPSFAEAMKQGLREASKGEQLGRVGQTTALVRRADSRFRSILQSPRARARPIWCAARPIHRLRHPALFPCFPHASFTLQLLALSARCITRPPAVSQCRTDERAAPATALKIEEQEQHVGRDLSREAPHTSRGVRVVQAPVELDPPRHAILPYSSLIPAYARGASVPFPFSARGALAGGDPRVQGGGWEGAILLRWTGTLRVLSPLASDASPRAAITPARPMIRYKCSATPSLPAASASPLPPTGTPRAEVLALTRHSRRPAAHSMMPRAWLGLNA
ncbi:hypothetical protein B0H15DRAFT_949690 [Mycena belliarum]|uniref:Uncharacterized protein n=1 Tax=Mycena belliarum TaxID=1033014 RepID=A0AAD6XP23_9AGAR|nr:hypothetical protein B0H15DRAFT_949690 [Mycena belliae]